MEGLRKNYVYAPLPSCPPSSINYHLSITVISIINSSSSRVPGGARGAACPNAGTVMLVLVFSLLFLFPAECANILTRSASVPALLAHRPPRRVLQHRPPAPAPAPEYAIACYSLSKRTGDGARRRARRLCATRYASWLVRVSVSVACPCTCTWTYTRRGPRDR